MGGIELVQLIIPRDMDERYLQFLHTHGMTLTYSFPCHGTAGQHLLDLLGLENTEKMMLLTFMEHEKAHRFLHDCVTQMGLEVPGSGVAFSIPLDSVGGMSSMNLLLENQEIDLEEVKKVDKQDLYPCALLVAICQAGHTDLVMDSARGAGARGGTVVHAKGTAGEMALKFFGVSLADEKELILILVNRSQKNVIMKAIMEKAGIQSEAHTVLFSLPVEEVAGLRSIMEDNSAAS